MTAPVSIAVEAPAREQAPSRALQMGLLAAFAAYVHVVCWAILPPDMSLFLFPWYQHILDHGPVGAFAQPFSNYTPPYLYLLAGASLTDPLLEPLHVIKLLSLAGSAFLALAVADLLKALGSDPRRALFVFVLPTVALNAALLGQCDALWAGSCVLAVAGMIRGRTISALVWCGVAVAFKAQAAFIAPVVIGALIGRRAPLWQWAVPPLVYAGMMVPAWLVGWPAADLATIYLRQAAWFETPGNLANPWVWFSEFAPAAATSFYAVGYAIAAAATVAIGASSAKLARNPKPLLLLALISAVAVPFLLPKMHERYFFLADVLALALALSSRDRGVIGIAVAVQFASLAALVSYIYDWRVPVLIGSLAAAAALAGAARVLHDFAARHHERNVLEHANIGERIAGDGDDVGRLAGLDRPHFLR
jgi:Gpi18-like mannosyltransferase